MAFMILSITRNIRHLLVVAGLVLAVRLALGADEKTSSGTSSLITQYSQEPDVSLLWKAIAADTWRTTPPDEWREYLPSDETLQAWLDEERIRLIALANRSREYCLKFPNDSHAVDAKVKEWRALSNALKISKDTETEKRCAEAESALLGYSSLPPKIVFALRAAKLQKTAANRDEYEKGLRELMKDFPDDNRAYPMLLSVLKGGENEHVRAAAEEIIQSNAPAEFKVEAKKLLFAATIIGKPLKFRFTAIDGKEYDLQKMKGKVVLIDFWATWREPCVAMMPVMKDVYTALHDKGFEIFGINFDSDKDQFKVFLKEQQMTWPQYFDGKGSQNKFGQEFHIDTLPRMWLVDKKGILRDMEAGIDLETKVENMLAEP